VGRGKLSDRRARHDRAYHDAKASGYAARAVFKLEELDAKFRLLGRGRRILDLGCWPGSWTQLAAERVGEDGLVVGIDLRPLDVALPAHAVSAVGDVEELDPKELVERFGDFDVVLSDMAPKTTGDRATDQIRSEALTARALEIARVVLRPGGHFAAKVFQGPGFGDLLKSLRESFSEAKSFHTRATRAGSKEQYLVGRGLKASARTFSTNS
jgi:23S rRNA (uridine2552-2'-O)-methyltransferase